MGMLNKSHRSAVVSEDTSINLGNCPNLHELTMSAGMFGDLGTATIKSIKSDIKKITFTKFPGDPGNPLYMGFDLWKDLDEALCGLEEGVELEVQIPRLSPGDDPRYEDCLPGFQKRGLVRFVDTTGKVVYSGGVVDRAG